jgi:hypothetical protein
MRIIRSLALAAAMVGSAAAAHAGVGVYVNVGGPRQVEYRPPCPGEGYVWAPGYYSGGYWIEGRWNAPAYYYGGRERVYYRDNYRHDWDRDRHWDRDRDHDRDRDRHWDRDRDHDRGRHEGWRR